MKDLDDSRRDFSALVREAAQRKGLVGSNGLASATRIAEASGVSVGQVNKYLNGESMPLGPNMRLLADALEVPYARLAEAAGDIGPRDVEFVQLAEDTRTFLMITLPTSVPLSLLRKLAALTLDELQQVEAFLETLHADR